MGLQPLAWWHSWNDAPWRDLAREELLLADAERGAPAMATYGWEAPTLVLGYGQAFSTVDQAGCEARGVSVFRRITGGTGVLHQGDLAASLALPSDHPWAGPISGLYDHLVIAVQTALAHFGLPVQRCPPPAHPPAGRSPICFEDHRGESLLIGGRKVMGCAQARRRGAVLVHATVLFGLDVPLQAAVYGVDAARIRGAMAALPPAPGLTPEALATRVARVLADGLGAHPPRRATPPPLPPDLLARASNPRWAVSVR